ncbi:MAG: phytoene desaturase [Ignavibacterium sp.]|nr:phytoene desaturase [Ignavibacterium sp.]
MKKRIGIVGSGLGGISAAIRLASSGYEVEIFESNSYPGGKAASIEFDGFRFDAGPSLFTMPFVLKDLFTEAGENLSDYLRLYRMDIICKYFYSDSTILNAYSDTNKFADEIELKTSDKKESVLNYLDYCKNIYDLTAELFLFNSPSQINTYFKARAVKTLFKINQIDPFRTMDKSNRKFFSDEKTIQLFNRYATYNGSDPYQAPATLNIIQHVEYNLGAFLPEKGIHQITQELYKLALKKNVNFHFNTEVKSLVSEYGSVQTINTSDNTYNFDAVISNSDVNTTFQKLLNDNKTFESKRYQKLEPSLSGLVFYWAINAYHPQLEVHNVIFSTDYKKEFEDIFKERIIPKDPTIYIYISSKFNQDDAPAGKENWFVMVNAPYINEQNWSDEIKSARKRIVDKITSVLGINIENNITGERILTPLDIQNKTGSYRGSIYGISSNNRNAAFLRQPNKSRSYKNLYFCGGSAHPGGGIPLVILSGKIVSDLIKKDIK